MQVVSRFQNLALWFNAHKFVVTLPFALVVFFALFLTSTSNTCAQGNCPVGTHGECTLLPSGKIKCYCEGDGGGGGGGSGQTPTPGSGGGGNNNQTVDVTVGASCVYMPGGPTGFGNLNVMVTTGRCKDDYYNIWIWYMDVCDWRTGACNVKMPVFIVSCAQGCKKQVNSPGETPCTEFSFNGTSLECNLNWITRARATIPPVQTLYSPYPRGLNRDPMAFIATGLATQDWQCSRAIDGWDPLTWSENEDFADFHFCLRWRQVAPPAPQESRNSDYGGYDPAPAWADWDWDERAWGNPKQSSSAGPIINHTYETSSADDDKGYGYERKPRNGPGNRPSYQVRVTTYWIVEWNMRWKVRHCRPDPDENPINTCKGQSKMIEFWIGHEDGPHGLDLRHPDIGNAHYWTSSNSILTPDGRKMDVLPVPVIEVQGIQPK